MNSLRRRLLVSLWVTLVLVGASFAAVTYLVTREETNSLLDYQMQQVATFVAAQAFPQAVTPGLAPMPAVEGDGDDAYFVSVRDAGGKLLYASRPGLAALMPDWTGFRTVTLGSSDYRVYSAQAGAHRIAVAQMMELRRETAAGATLAALLPVVVLIPLLGLVISYVMRRQLRPLSVIAREVAGRPALALEPLPVAGLPAEVLPLINEINRLLARLAEASQLEQRFIADAAHALRTPLAALQLQADVLDGSPDAATQAVRLAELRAGIRRTVRLANQLLLLARDDAAGGPMSGLIRVDAALIDAAELHAPIAAVRGVRLQVEADSGAVARGNARDIAQLAGSLLDNAIRHSPDGGRVDASVVQDAGCAWIEIADEGPGLPDSELEKVFERFYRAPGELTEGSGLGLAAVREAAKRLGGRASLSNRRDRSGLIARVCLPLVMPQDSELRGRPS